METALEELMVRIGNGDETRASARCPAGYFPRFNLPVRRKMDCPFLCLHTDYCQKQQDSLKEENEAISQLDPSI